MVERLRLERGAEVEWRPFYLRPDTPAEGMELPAGARAGMGALQERLRQMAQDAGLKMVFPSRLPNTRRAHEATEYARAHGKHEDFHRVVFRQFYGEGRDISRWEILRAAAQEVGLDPDAMQREVEKGAYSAVVEQYITEAARLGIDGVPTYILDGKYAIVGAQPYAAFERTLARLASDAGRAANARRPD